MGINVEDKVGSVDGLADDAVLLRAVADGEEEGMGDAVEFDIVVEVEVEKTIDELQKQELVLKIRDRE